MDPRYRFDLDEPCCRCLHNQGTDQDEPCLRCQWNVIAYDLQRLGEFEIGNHFQIIPGDQYADNVEAYLRAVTENVI